MPVGLRSRDGRRGHRRGAVVLVTALTARLGGAGGDGGGGLGAAAALPPDQVGLPAASFGTAFWWAFGFVVVACLVALVLLPQHKPAPLDDDAAAPRTTGGTSTRS